MGIVFFGCVEIGFRCLQRVRAEGAAVAGVVTLPPKYAASTSGYVDFAPFCVEHGLPLYQTDAFNDPDLLPTVQAWAPELIVVCGWQRIVSPEILAAPPRGSVGFHSSLLPRYRGRAPVNWAIIKGEKEGGVTFFRLDGGVDTGPIVDQARFAIGPFDTCATFYDKSATACEEMLARHLPGLLAGTAPLRDNPSADYPIMPKRTPDDGLVDWSLDAVTLHNLVRGLTRPYPGAFALLGDRKLFIWSALPLHPGLELGLAPGAHMSAPGQGVAFGCGQGEGLLVTAAQFEGEDEVRPDLHPFFRDEQGGRR